MSANKDPGNGEDNDPHDDGDGKEGLNCLAKAESVEEHLHYGTDEQVEKVRGDSPAQDAVVEDIFFLALSQLYLKFSSSLLLFLRHCCHSFRSLFQL
mgnify:CR=1 FL=1